MHPLAQLTPMLALLLSQLGDNESKLTVYGPMGIICMWLMYRDEKRSSEHSKAAALASSDNAGLREEIRGVAHQMKGLNRNLLYNAAVHGPEPLRTIAAKELERTSELAD